MRVTAEEILALLVEGFGPELGEKIWTHLNPRLEGRHVYWAKRAGRRLVERNVYERKAQGRPVGALAAAEGCSERTVYRMVRRALHRIRKAA